MFYPHLGLSRTRCNQTSPLKTISTCVFTLWNNFLRQTSLNRFFQFHPVQSYVRDVCPFEHSDFERLFTWEELIWLVLVWIVYKLVQIQHLSVRTDFKKISILHCTTAYCTKPHVNKGFWSLSSQILKEEQNGYNYYLKVTLSDQREEK